MRREYRPRGPALFFCALYAISCIAYLHNAVQAQPPGSVDPPTSPTQAPDPPLPMLADPAATLFLNKCSSCHTVGGGPIGDAPDLLPSTQWSRVDLETAIKRMEKNVGPLTGDEIDQLAGLMMAPDLKSRLEAARQSQATQRRQELEPASASKGRELFFGAKALANGGMACAACHKAGDAGGTLGRDLTHVFNRMGETALLSAVQNANFPLMQPAYAEKPVTAQEAVHIVKYLEDVHLQAADPAADPSAAISARVFGWVGVLAAGVSLGAMALRLKQVDRGGGVRAQLVKQATRSGKS